MGIKLCTQGLHDYPHCYLDWTSLAPNRVLWQSNLGKGGKKAGFPAKNRHLHIGNAESKICTNMHTSANERSDWEISHHWRPQAKSRAWRKGTSCSRCGWLGHTLRYCKSTAPMIQLESTATTSKQVTTDEPLEETWKTFIFAKRIPSQA